MRKEKKVIASVLLSVSLLFGSFVIFNQDEIKADYYDYEFATTTPATETTTEFWNQSREVMWDDWYDVLGSVPKKKDLFFW